VNASCQFGGAASPPYPCASLSGDDNNCDLSTDIAQGGFVTQIDDRLAVLSTLPSSCHPQGQHLMLSESQYYSSGMTVIPGFSAFPLVGYGSSEVLLQPTRTLYYGRDPSPGLVHVTLKGDSTLRCFTLLQV
jgi:hypothetical protein